MSRHGARLVARCALGLLAACAAACGGAAPMRATPMAPQVAPSGGQSETAQPGGDAAPATESSGTSPPPPFAVQRPVMPGQGVPTVDGATQSGGVSLAGWQSQLDQGLQELSAGSTSCGDICRAAGNICVASREICALTGDNSLPAPRDERCARARAACDQATHQREASCPVCPP